MRLAAGLERPAAALARPAVAWSVFAAAAALWLVLHFLNHPAMLDLEVYRSEGFALRHGSNLYGDIHAPFHLRGTYPPFAAMLFVPLTVLPLGLCYALAGVGNLALIAAAVALTRRLAGPRRLPAVAVPLLAAAAIWLEPVYLTLHYGQINLLLLALVLWDFARPSGAPGRGVGLGLAAAIKVTPALLVVYLLLTRRFRFAATAAGTAVVATLLSLALRPHQTWRFWTDLVFRTDRVGNTANPDNQSVHGLLVRALGRVDLGAAGAVATALVLAAGLACAVLAFRRSGEPLGVCAAAVTGLLVSPISWSHHWVWCIPIGVLVAVGVIERRAGAWLAALGYVATFATYTFWSFASYQPANLQMPVADQLRSAIYVAFGVALLAVAALSTGRRPVRADGRRSGDACRRHRDTRRPSGAGSTSRRP